MPERWLIVADDLTGAADAGVAFARRGVKTKVLLPNAQLVDKETMTVAYDADTRRSTPTQAGARHAQAVARFGAPDTNVYKKIDSTLRGHPAVEIAAMREVLAAHRRPTAAVFAPAFPAMGRTTRDGHVYVHGKPLEESETWQREHSYPNADLAELLASAGMTSKKVPLARVRAGTAALREELEPIFRDSTARFAKVAICDAETDADLDCIASAVAAPDSKAFLIGTAGLAHAVARRQPASERAPLCLKGSAAGALVAIGSLATVTRQAARTLASQSGIMSFHIDAGTLRDTGTSGTLRAQCSSIIRAVETGTDVLVEIAEDVAPDLGHGDELVRALAAGLAEALGRVSGLVVSGGETAAALLSQLFVDEIELTGEVEPGVVLGLARDHREFPIVTKPGAFGDADSLVRALEKLRMIRRTGTLA